MEILKNKWVKIILLISIGALGGFLYYYFIGCLGGSCPITSNPYLSMIYGGIIGALLIPRNKQINSEENEK